MQIKIPLPKCSSSNTYQEMKSYLKQLELAVHHAQKAVESAEKEGVELIEGDAYISFHHRLLETINVNEIKDMSNFSIDHYDELQEIELDINLA